MTPGRLLGPASCLGRTRCNDTWALAGTGKLSPGRCRDAAGTLLACCRDAVGMLPGRCRDAAGTLPCSDRQVVWDEIIVMTLGRSLGPASCLGRNRCNDTWALAITTRNSLNSQIRLFISCNKKIMTFGHFDAEPGPGNFCIRVSVSWALAGNVPATSRQSPGSVPAASRQRPRNVPAVFLQWFVRAVLRAHAISF